MQWGRTAQSDRFLGLRSRKRSVLLWEDERGRALFKRGGCAFRGLGCTGREDQLSCKCKARRRKRYGGQNADAAERNRLWTARGIVCERNAAGHVSGNAGGPGQADCTTSTRRK